MSIYESDRLLAEYLLFHYGADPEILPWPDGPVNALHYPVRCVTECFDLSRLPPQGRALDLGCAVGRSSFELARYFPEVIGIDYSERFIAAARQLCESGAVHYARIDEGDLASSAVALVPEGIDRRRVHFERGDAMDLRDHLGAFDAVLLANLIDRLPDPKRCLGRLPGLVNPGGQLVITSPYTWLEEFTPRANWLGFRRDGHSIFTHTALRSLLDADFEFLCAKDLPFLIREHQRKFQWSVAEATIWRRR